MLQRNFFIVFLSLLMSPLVTFASNDWCSSDEKNRPFKFEWIPEKPAGYSAGILKISEASSGKVIQEIKNQASDGKWTPDFTDWNFDGCPDLTWTELAAKNNALVVMVYDSGKQQFEYSEPLSQLSALKVENQHNKCLSAGSADGVDRGQMDTYCWRSGKLVQVESKYWLWNEKKQCQQTVVERLKKGKLRKVSVKCEKVMADDSAWQSIYKK